MKIKEAAQYCALTEKAIRLYETKGLIHPKTEEKNGRTFREYDTDTLRTLMTIGTLRRASFSIEQIGIMQASPERIPEVFAAYRDEVRENAAQLAALSRAMDSIGEAEILNLDQFASRLAAAMLPDDSTPALEDDRAEPSEEAADAATARYRGYVWDEDIKPDEKEEAYQRFLMKLERREKLEALLLAVPHEIAAVWHCFPKKIRIGLIVFAVLYLISALMLYNMVEITPYQIELAGVEYCRGNSDPSHVTPITVTFDGELYRFLFKKDYFTGTIEIEGYTLKHPLYEDMAEQICEIERLYYEDFPTRLDTKLSMSDFFKGARDEYKIHLSAVYLNRFEDTNDLFLVLTVMELVDKTDTSSHYRWDGTDGMYIVAPAETRDDAEYLVRRCWEIFDKKYQLDAPIK